MSTEEKARVDVLLEGLPEGDAASIFELAVLKYWKYAKLPSITDNEIDRWLEVADSTGNGDQSLEIGQFYHGEFQDGEAQYYYEQALRKHLEEAAAGDADAMFSLSKQYAFGIGTEQDPEKACFWCQAAAQNGHEEAACMMENFWQDGRVLPVSDDMATHRTAGAGSSTAETRQLRQAVTEKETAAGRLAAEKKRLASGRTDRYKIHDLSKTPKGRVTGFISDRLCELVILVAVVFVIVSALSYLISFFAGYHEGGFLHIVNQLAYWLGFPLKLLMTWTTDYAMAEITPELLWTHFSFSGLFTGLWRLVTSCVVYVIWLLLVALVAYIVFMIFCCIRHCGLEIEAQEATPSREQELAAALQKAEAQIPEALKKYNSAQLLALCDMAERTGRGLPEAARSFDALSAQDNEPTHEVQLLTSSGAYSTLALYFLLPLMGLPYAKPTLYNFDRAGSFMRGYRTLRRGKDFRKASYSFLNAVEGESTPAAEKGWAAWYLACLNRREFMPRRTYTDQWQEIKRNCLETAEKMESLAAENGCIKMSTAEADISALLWQFDLDALTAMAVSLKEESPRHSQFFEAMAKEARAVRNNCGEPFNAAMWKDYIMTDCIYPKVADLQIRYEKIQKKFSDDLDRLGEVSAYKYEQEPLKKLISDLRPCCGKGLYAAEELMKLAKDDLQLAESVVQIDRNERRAEMEAREAAINRKLSEFDDKADNVERRLNDFFNNSMDTNLERALTGRMSQKDFLMADDLRHQAREKYRKELEEEARQAARED